MDKKLIVSLDQKTIENAKKYARSNNISLSKLIEAYLKSLTKGSKSDAEITPLVESLSGVVRLEDNVDYKKQYTDFKFLA